ncbi:glycogen debranching N-terminal domain-containing protein [Plantactinospora sp. WMMB334]|uniref:amylo-alpha-1,6-glucosidase n=1 Tax=Plantactinospora sp. WMMB334 TaxID=3404119 RepID=UPI003B932179
MEDERTTILEGLTFIVSARNGDVDPAPGEPDGLYFLDTRFLSRWVVTVDGNRLTPLSVDDLQYFEARFFLVPGEPRHYVSSTQSVIRHRSTVAGMDEEVTVLNHTDQPVEATIRLEVASDFLDVNRLGNPPVPREGEFRHAIGDRQLQLEYLRGRFRRATIVRTSTEPAGIDSGGMTFTARLAPHGAWNTRFQVTTDIRASSGAEVTGAGRSLREMKEGMRDELDAWIAAAPRLETGYGPLVTAYRRSLIDLAALANPGITGRGKLPAAGLPYLNIAIGRQCIFTSLQTLPFLPGLAADTLRLLATDQGAKLDDHREEEPGKIIHLLRFNEGAAFEERPYLYYYASADATPLFVVLLDEYERWTGDVGLVRTLEKEARRALDWIDEWGDLVGDGYLWYQRPRWPDEPPNQCWKESEPAICYADGRRPGWPRATCELQGYAYDAKRRGARMARLFWDDPAYAHRLEEQAADLRDRFNRDYWLADRGYYALAREVDGTPVDALTSNIGHLLWSGIVDADRAPALVEHLLGSRLFSGWGVRTLATGEANHNPVGYHIGTVWPYDNSVIAEGMRRYGFAAEASTIAQSILDAAPYFQGRLPEAFTGYDRALTTYPVRYPTANSPQGWSAGAVLSLLRTLLGLAPHPDHLESRALIPPEIGEITLFDVCGRWGSADVFGRARKPDTTGRCSTDPDGSG